MSGKLASEDGVERSSSRPREGRTANKKESQDTQGGIRSSSRPERSPRQSSQEPKPKTKSALARKDKSREPADDQPDGDATPKSPDGKSKNMRTQNSDGSKSSTTPKPKAQSKTDKAPVKTAGSSSRTASPNNEPKVPNDEPKAPNDEPFLTMGPTPSEQASESGPRMDAMPVNRADRDGGTQKRTNSKPKEGKAAKEKVSASATTASTKPKLTEPEAPISQRPQYVTSAAASVQKEKEKKDDQQRAPKSMLAKEEEARCLSQIWPLLGSKTGSLRKVDAETLLSTLVPGGVNSEAFDAFWRSDLGSSTLTEKDFIERATKYFDACEPKDDCIEVWQMVGGSSTREGTIDCGDLSDALEKLNQRMTRAEMEDLVAFASYGNDRLAYDDFVRALFPSSGNSAFGDVGARSTEGYEA